MEGKCIHAGCFCRSKGSFAMIIIHFLGGGYAQNIISEKRRIFVCRLL